MTNNFWEKLKTQERNSGPAPVPVRPQHFKVVLPGRLSPMDFLGSFTLTSASSAEPFGTRDLAHCEEWARAVAADRTRMYNPLHWIQAQHHANQALASGLSDRSLPRPIDATVTLSVPSQVFTVAKLDYEERLAQAVDSARYRAIAESRFADPRVAYVWWLENDPKRLSKLDELSHFLQLMHPRPETEPSGPSETPGDPRYAWLPLAARFVDRLDEAQLAYLVRRLPEIFRAFRQPDLADEVEDRYGGPGGHGTAAE